MIHLIQEKSLHLGVVCLGVGGWHAWMICGTCLVINHKGQMGTCFFWKWKNRAQNMLQSAQLTV